jgi:GNAT superfamily N-acetyltransferase
VLASRVGLAAIAPPGQRDTSAFMTTTQLMTTTTPTSNTSFVNAVLAQPVGGLRARFTIEQLNGQIGAHVVHGAITDQVFVDNIDAPWPDLPDVGEVDLGHGLVLTEDREVIVRDIAAVRMTSFDRDFLRGGSLFETCDEKGGDLFAFYEDLKPQAVEAFEDEHGIAIWKFGYVESVRVRPEFRGNTIGHFAMDATIAAFPGMDAWFLHAAPTEKLLSDRAAKAKLAKYWESCLFQRLSPRSPLFVRTTHYRLDNDQVIASFKKHGADW